MNISELKKNTNTVSSLLEKQKKVNIVEKMKRSRMELLNKKLKNTAGVVQEIEIDKLKENPYQPRIEIKKEEIEDLAKSIKEKGLIQPVIVTKTDEGIIIVAGHRRVEAHKLLGEDKIKAIFIETSPALLAELSIIENLQREDLDLIETAIALKKYKEEFNKSYEEIAKEIGKSKTYIVRVVNILNLPDEIIKDIKENKSTKDINALNMLNTYSKKVAVHMCTDNQNADFSGDLEEYTSQKWKNEILELYKGFLENGREWLKKEIENRLNEMENVKKTNQPIVDIKVTKKHGITVKINKQANKEKINEFQKELERLIKKYFV